MLLPNIPKNVLLYALRYFELKGESSLKFAFLHYFVIISTGAPIPEAITIKHVMTPISQLLTLFFRAALFENRVGTTVLTAFIVKVVTLFLAAEPSSQPISKMMEIMLTERSILRVVSDKIGISDFAFAENCWISTFLVLRWHQAIVRKIAK